MTKTSITRLEIGPHFVTVYGYPFYDLMNVARRAYSMFLKWRPDLEYIQQENFNHEKDDPNVYHPYGEPDTFFKDYRHFHIRYGSKPTEEDIQLLWKLLARYKAYPTEDLEICQLGDYRVREFDYPLPPDNLSEYLDYIDKLRMGCTDPSTTT